MNAVILSSASIAYCTPLEKVGKVEKYVEAGKMKAYTPHPLFPIH